MLALKQSGRSTPDMLSLAESPGCDGVFQTHQSSQSEAPHKNFLAPEIDQPDDNHGMHRQLPENSGDHQVGSGRNCLSPDTDHHLSHTIPKQTTEWVGRSELTSQSHVYSIRDGYATWGGRRRAMSGKSTDEARERGFGELKPLNHALEQVASRQQRLAPKETSSDYDSPPVFSRTRGGKAPPKPSRHFDERIKAVTSKPTSVLVKKVVLRRKSSVSDFGFSVADGATEPGVFVKAVRPGGPAMDRLKAFDKILQVG